MPRRRNLAKQLPIISGKVILLQDFLVHPQQGAGFVFAEIEAADLPEEAMYFDKHPDTKQIIFAMPQARSSQARYNLTHSPTDPTYKFDESYWWRERAAQAKEEGASNVQT